jgi:hypothetical protein
MKDSWVYRSGDLWLPSSVVAFLDSYLIGNETSLFYLNLWHVNHFLSGVFFGLLLRSGVYSSSSPFLTYLLFHTVWEMWQLAIGMTPRSLRGLLDITVDTVVGLLGLFLVWKLT